jgi:hypothetical protein
MKNQISAYLLIGLILLGVSAHSVVYAQNTAQPQQTINSLAPQSGFTTNKVINLNDLDVSNSDRQSLEDVFENCPAGIILYQLSGQFYVYCLKTPVSGVLYGAGGQQIDIDIKVDRSSSNNDDNDDNDDDSSNGPDEDCLFNASLPKCDPDEDGNCPDDFNLNEDGNCFPDHHETGCPSGTHGVDDDETGQCYDNDDGCPDGMELNEDGNNCGYIPDEEILPTPLDTAAMADTVTNTGEDKGFVDDATNNKILPDIENNANAAASDTTTTDLNDEELEKGAVDEQPDSTTDTEDTDSNSNEPEGDTNEDSGDSDTNESDSESSSNDDGGSEESGGEEDNN